MTYVLIARPKYMGKIEAIEEFRNLNKAIAACEELHRHGKFYRTMVLDEQLKPVFKIERKCKCTNIQWVWDIDLDLIRAKCEDCGVYHPCIESEVGIG